MTTITTSRRWNMSRRFTDGSRAIMATRTGANHFQMIDLNNRCPDILAMTGITGITGINMRRGFTRRYCTVVAGDTSR